MTQSLGKGQGRAGRLRQYVGWAMGIHKSVEKFGIRKKGIKGSVSTGTNAGTEGWNKCAPNIYLFFLSLLLSLPHRPFLPL